MSPRTFLASYLCLLMAWTPVFGATSPKDYRPVLNGAQGYASNLSSNPTSFRNLVSDEIRNTEGTQPPIRGREFVSGNYDGAVLMPVRVVGAVEQAGLHHVPTGTDLVELLALAGGPTQRAELDEVRIKRWTDKGFVTEKVDLEEFFEHGTAKPIELLPNDIVMLPTREPLINENTLTIISVVTSVVGIIASSVLIANGLSR